MPPLQNFKKDQKHIQNRLTSSFWVSFFGSVSTGLMQATPGEMKSFKSSAERMALIVQNADTESSANIHITPTTLTALMQS